MNTSTRRVSISLPQKLFEEFEQERARHHTTKSEFVRHLFRAYKVLSRRPVTLSEEEREAVKQAREEVARGECVTLNDLDDGVGRRTS